MPSAALQRFDGVPLDLDVNSPAKKARDLGPLTSTEWGRTVSMHCLAAEANGSQIA